MKITPPRVALVFVLPILSFLTLQQFVHTSYRRPLRRCRSPARLANQSGCSGGKSCVGCQSLASKMYPDLQEYGACSAVEERPYQRGSFWVLENYFRAQRTFPYGASVTYATHGERTFLENLEGLAQRWQGPVSMSVYAPDKDFHAAVEAILHLRRCGPEVVRNLVSFHLIFPVGQIPQKIPSQEELSAREVDCSQGSSRWTKGPTERVKKGLPYPINVARNAARQASQTYFVLVSDVELYPSLNFIPDFLEMLQQPDLSQTDNPRVYVLPIFEVQSGLEAPRNKSELVELFKAKKVVTFHHYICKKCHLVPKFSEWIEAPLEPGLSVFHVAKRKGAFKNWEPIYVGTHMEPFYEEGLSWEGEKDKMTQMYVLCVQDYEFHVLDNAFLVHRPGIKMKKKKTRSRNETIKKQNQKIEKEIIPLYNKLYGHRFWCSV